MILTDNLNYCHDHKVLRINAFVIMHTHIHLILFDRDFDNDRLRLTLRDMSQFTGRKLADFCNRSMPDAFKQVINNPA